MAYLIGAHLKASFPYHFGIEKESNVRTLLDVVLPLSRFELKYSAISDKSGYPLATYHYIYKH
jgi:hypothetical protein